MTWKLLIFIQLIFTVFTLQASSAPNDISYPDEFKNLLFSRSCKDYQKACTKVPDFLKTQKDLCEIKRAANKCDQFEKAKPEDDWKYIKCDYNRLCSQNVVSEMDSAMACLYGAVIGPVEVAKLLKLLASGAVAQIMKTNKMVADCDKSIQCKRKWALGSPAMKHLAEPKNEESLKKVTAAMLYSKKVEWDPRRVEYMNRGLITKEQYYKEIGWNPPANSKLVKIPTGDEITLLAMWAAITEKMDSEYREVSCYIPFEKTRLKCNVLSDVLGGIGLYEAASARMAKGVTAIAREGAEAIDRRITQKLIHIAESSSPKRALVKEYAQKVLTTKSENEKWKAFISSPTPRQRTMTVENWKLKDLNDNILKDEEYVTSLMNLAGDMQIRNYHLLEDRIKKQYPDFEFKIASDFKSVKVAYDDIPGFKLDGKSLEDLLKETADNSNNQFADYVLKNKLVREADKPKSWYKAAAETTDDWTNLKAKYTRTQGADDSMFLPKEKEAAFKTWAEKEVTDGNRVKAEVLATFKDTAMVTGKNADAKLDVGVYAILRKNKDNPEQAKSLIEKTYGLQPLSEKNFENLRQHFDMSDVTSPGLRGTERTFATLADAPHGGISIDMIDLGAEHIQQTSAAAFGKAKNADDFLSLSRKSEEELTDKILKRKEQIEKTFREVTGDSSVVVQCSGDGCKAFLKGRQLTDTEAQRFADIVTANGEQGKLRFSTINKLDSREYADLIAKQGEDLEKNLRKALADKMDLRRLSGLNFSVAIRAEVPGAGTAQLHISTASGLRLSEYEKAKIAEIYKKTLSESKMGYK